MEQIEEWLSYQLDDSTAKKLDNRPFPLLSHTVFFYIIISVRAKFMLPLTSSFANRSPPMVVGFVHQTSVFVFSVVSSFLGVNLQICPPFVISFGGR